MFATTPDLLRLLVVPVFAWAAWRDVRTRRLPNRVWAPLVVLGVVALAWDVILLLPVSSVADRLFLVRVAVSLGLVVPLSYAFWRLGAFGGADAKALMVLALVFPAFPTYVLPTTPPLALPVQSTALGVFSMTILTNTVLVGLAYPLALAARNLVAGDVGPVMFLGTRMRVEELPTAHGRLFEDTHGTTRRGLDLDALRMYLRWRGLGLAELRRDPDAARDPASVGTTHDPTDGAVGERGPATDGGSATATAEADRPSPTDGEVASDGVDAASTVASAGSEDSSDFEDPWAAARFLDDVEGSAYGTTPESLREGLAVVADRETVWVSPGLPFVVPMFVGLLLALAYGDLLFGAMGALGLA